MQASGTTERGHQSFHLLVIRTCLRCEETSEHMWTGDEVEHGAEQQGRLQPRNTSDSWALGAGSGEEPQTDVHTLLWAAGSKMGFSQGPCAPSLCFQSVLLLPSPSYPLQE